MKAFRIWMCMMIMLSAWSDSAAAREESAGALRRVVAEFARSLADGDFLATLDLFNPALQAERMDYAVFMKRTGIVHAEGLIPVPDYPGYLETNRAVFANRMISDIKRFVYSLLLPEEYVKGGGREYRFPGDMPPEDIAVRLEEMAAMLNPDALRGLECVRMDRIKPEQRLSELNKIYLFDDSAEFFLLYSFGGKHYLGTMTLCRFDDSWVIRSLGSILAPGDLGKIAGSVLPMTVEEYGKIVAGERAPGGASRGETQ